MAFLTIVERLGWPASAANSSAKFRFPMLKRPSVFGLLQEGVPSNSDSERTTS